MQFLKKYFFLSRHYSQILGLKVLTSSKNTENLKKKIRYQMRRILSRSYRVDEKGIKENEIKRERKMSLTSLRVAERE